MSKAKFEPRYQVGQTIYACYEPRFQFNRDDGPIGKAVPLTVTHETEHYLNVETKKGEKIRLEKTREGDGLYQRYCDYKFFARSAFDALIDRRDFLRGQCESQRSSLAECERKLAEAEALLEDVA